MRVHAYTTLSRSSLVLLASAALLLGGQEECSSTDSDGDGWTVEAGDCDDSDPTVYPGAPEACDGLDNDCNGVADDNLSAAYDLHLCFPDIDGDGFGTTDAPEPLCTCPDGYAPARGDCDDTDPAIHPGANDGDGDGVDQDCGGTGGPDPHVGLSGQSFPSIQSALNAAQPGMVVWVGRGTYREAELRFASSGVALMSTHLADATTIDAGGAGSVMIFDQGEGPDTVVDGFTLTGGDTSGNGAGVYLKGSSPTFARCVITANTAGYDGGGLYLEDSSPTLTRCSITANVGIYGGGLRLKQSQVTIRDATISMNLSSAGGGAIRMEDSTVSLENCTLSTNHVWYDGGAAIYAKNATLTATNCRFDGNFTTLGADLNGGEGGALWLSGSSATLDHCALTNNAVHAGMFDSGMGGAMYLNWTSSASLQHCVVTGNLAASSDMDSSPGVGGIVLYDSASTLEIVDSVLAYNQWSNLTVPAGASATAGYTDLYNPDEWGNHNLEVVDATVLEVEPDFLTYDLDGMPMNLHLAQDSPLVDAGNPADFDADSTRSDIGIYGGSAGAAFDLDADGFHDYFWPGTIRHAPEGYNPSDWDCDDQDPNVHLCQ